jgi:hypothetical protein
MSLSPIPTRPFPAVDPLLTITAGVYGFCQSGPGVLGQGSDADNPTSYGEAPVGAGSGVVGMGGNATAATTVTMPPNPPVTNPALPGGAGVVGLGGNAAMPAAGILGGTGVVGIGSPMQAGSELPGRGGVFGVTGYAAQVRLIPGPPPFEKPLLPVFGEVGDLYITRVPNPQSAHLPGLPVMFMCVIPTTTKEPAMWVPFVVGPQQRGGSTPHA